MMDMTRRTSLLFRCFTPLLFPLSLLFLFFLSTLFCGCGKEEGKTGKLKIGVSVPAASHGWTGGVLWHAEQAKQRIESGNPDTEILLSSAATAAEQVERIENLLARGIDALVVMAQEPGPLTGICGEAKKQGVYLVVVSNPLSEAHQDVFVNGSNRSFGKAAAEATGKLLNGKGDILVMEGVPSPINTERVSAFREELEKSWPEIRILESQASYWNAEKGLALMENFLQKHPKVDAVWTGDDDVLSGAVKGYAESGRTDLKAMIGGGGAKNVVKRILDGDPLVKATVSYSPAMIETGMDQALAGLRNGKVPPEGKKEIIIPSEIITRENAEKFYFPDSVY